MHMREYNRWLENAKLDPDLIAELQSMKDDEVAINDAFYKDLSFGTAGLRGVIGAGTNRMNVYTVGKATQGLAEYVKSVSCSPGVAIAYDSRIKSEAFARVAAEILAANGVKVYIYREIMPTPMLSYAVRYFKCESGIVITASHNPAKYNGYKAYGPDGCQMGPEAADYVLSIMNKVDVFRDIKRINFKDGLNSGLIEYIGDEVINSYLNEVEKCRVNRELDLSEIKILYTPLNGTGNKPVRSIFSRIGATDVTVVKEQELPDGNFPTAPYPNPEIREAFDCAFKTAKEVHPDLIIATDPDADRTGIAVRKGEDYLLISGNDVGALLFEYILKCRRKNGTLPERPFAVKTIVSTDICKKIAADYGCELKEVLTGFKFIGEQIGILESKGEENRYVFGFEESYGYLAGPYVRDKDAVVASMLICEMAAYYKKEGKDLLEVLEDIYDKYGYFLCIQKSFVCEGQAGMKKISDTMEKIRSNPPKSIAGNDVSVFKDFKVSVATDFNTGKTQKILLPKSNVLGFYLKDGSYFIIRPSGTEPKIKLYVCANGKSRVNAAVKRDKMMSYGTEILGL
ncbi:MAG: phospho-sugar mutase [Clostridia bacterium]|nr:phospho-sugar mutase [Clostridia bacterium]